VGDMPETVALLIHGNPDLDFIYEKSAGDKGYKLDTRELREVLGGDVPLNDPGVDAWIRDYLTEQEQLLF